MKQFFTKYPLEFYLVHAWVCGLIVGAAAGALRWFLS